MLSLPQHKYLLSFCPVECWSEAYNRFCRWDPSFNFLSHWNNPALFSCPALISVNVFFEYRWTENFLLQWFMDKWSFSCWFPKVAWIVSFFAGLFAWGLPARNQGQSWIKRLCLEPFHSLYHPLNFIKIWNNFYFRVETFLHFLRITNCISRLVSSLFWNF